MVSLSGHSPRHPADDDLERHFIYVITRWLYFYTILYRAMYDAVYFIGSVLWRKSNSKLVASKGQIQRLTFFACRQPHGNPQRLLSGELTSIPHSVSVTEWSLPAKLVNIGS